MKLIFLPGLDGTGLLFTPILSQLKGTFKTQIISYNNCDKQTYPALTSYALSQLPTDENFILIAESFSGRIAFEIGLRKPIHLKGIIFVATFLHNPRPFLLKFRKLLPLALYLKSYIPDALTRRMLFAPSTSDELLTQFWKAISLVKPNQLNKRLTAITTLTEIEQNVNTPSLYLQAMQDKLIQKKNYQGFDQHCANIEFHSIHGSHFLLQTAPEVCAKTIKKFSENLSIK